MEKKKVDKEMKTNRISFALLTDDEYLMSGVFWRKEGVTDDFRSATENDFRNVEDEKGFLSFAEEFGGRDGLKLMGGDVILKKKDPAEKQFRRRLVLLTRENDYFPAGREIYFKNASSLPVWFVGFPTEGDDGLMAVTANPGETTVINRRRLVADAPRKKGYERVVETWSYRYDLPNESGKSVSGTLYGAENEFVKSAEPDKAKIAYELRFPTEAVVEIRSFPDGKLRACERHQGVCATDVERKEILSHRAQRQAPKGKALERIEMKRKEWIEAREKERKERIAAIEAGLVPHPIRKCGTHTKKRNEMKDLFAAVRAMKARGEAVPEASSKEKVPVRGRILWHRGKDLADTVYVNGEAYYECDEPGVVVFDTAFRRWLQPSLWKSDGTRTGRVTMERYSLDEFVENEFADSVRGEGEVECRALPTITKYGPDGTGKELKPKWWKFAGQTV